MHLDVSTSILYLRTDRPLQTVIRLQSGMGTYSFVRHIGLLTIQVPSTKIVELIEFSNVVPFEVAHDEHHEPLHLGLHCLPGRL